MKSKTMPSMIGKGATKRQRQRESLARSCESWLHMAGINVKSQAAMELRAVNRRIDMKKGQTRG
jgi:hypothetical protein